MAAEGSDMPALVNWELLRNPINWVVVVLMLLIGAFMLRLLMEAPNYAGQV